MKYLMSLLLMWSLSCSAAPKPIQTIHLTGRNTVLIDTEMSFNSAHTFIQAISGARLMLPPNETLYILIASGGGYYQVALIEQLVLARVPGVAIICRYCGSAAGYIFVTAKVPRLVTKGSILMMHHMFIDHMTAEMASDVQAADRFQEQSDEFDKAIYTVLRMTKEDYNSKIKGSDIWEVKGQDIVDTHGADRLIKVSCDEYIKRLAPNTCADEE